MIPFSVLKSLFPLNQKIVAHQANRELLCRCCFGILMWAFVLVNSFVFQPKVTADRAGNRATLLLEATIA